MLQVYENWKTVAVWLTREEEKDEVLRQHLKKLYQEYTSRKFKVAEFHSGTESLYELTRDWLLYNRKRTAELEHEAEKGLAYPDLSTSYSGTLPVQC